MSDSAEIKTIKPGLPPLVGFKDLLSDMDMDAYYKAREQEEKEKAAERELIRREAWYRSADSGIKKRFHNESFETFKAETDEEKRNLKICKDFCAADGCRMLLLYGENGNGKTHLASSVIREIGGVYVTSAMLCLEFESGADFNANRNRLEVVKHYSNTGVLVIDEIGRNVNAETEKKLLPLIIGNIYDNCGKIVLVTNADKMDFVELMGKAIYDRFMEVCYSCSFTEKSKRQELRK